MKLYIKRKINKKVNTALFRKSYRSNEYLMNLENIVKEIKKGSRENKKVTKPWLFRKSNKK